MRELVTQRSTSLIANMPIMAGMKLTPPISSTVPKVKRGWPAVGSMPTVATKSPMRTATIPFTGRPVEMNTAQERPNVASQKYSKLEKSSANSASIGAKMASTIEPNRPPITEKTRPAPSTRSAWPFFVSRCASST